MHTFPLEKNVLLSLYGKGNSAAQIAIILHCSMHKVIYWMDKFDIPRRNLSDALYCKNNPHGDPYSISSIDTIQQSFLYGLGLGIYWGEGNKVSRHSVRVSNSDPSVIKAFLHFLKKICHLKDGKVSYSLICFKNQDSEILRVYWSSVLKISPKKFGTITKVPSHGKGTYKRIQPFGVCSVSVGNIKLKAWMLEQLQLMSTIEGLDSLVAKQTLGKG